MSINPKLPPLPEEEWPATLRPILDDMQGRPLNVHKLMANHPELLKAWWSFRNYSVTGGDLSQRQCELVILRTAHHTGAMYEWASHVDRGQKAGLSLDEINRVRTGPDAPEWSKEESLLLKAVDDCEQGKRIEPDTLAALTEFYSNRQVMDIIAIQGVYIILGNMINTWGLELDGFINVPDTAP
jgi:alkylhydroperoxidase family enzyme